ncbi:unnamed protein product [Owenia fusiformis]|uniref:Uncharacterized protein n=1 Tax=Owenia fusiformis TaxID=6347 RepID=A0A8J1UCB5_OWEFU|nr:unnamed protein product [Owenia fusiformis]
MCEKYSALVQSLSKHFTKAKESHEMAMNRISKALKASKSSLMESKHSLTMEIEIDAPLKDFSKADEFSDAVLIVEGQDLHVHRVYLAEWSPVFKQMFLKTTPKKKKYRLALTDKNLEQIRELLHCIYSSQKPVTDENVYYLLQLAEEYQIIKVTERCELFLISQDPSVESLVLAQRYNLSNLRQHAINLLKHRVVGQLENLPGYPMLTPETLAHLYKARAEHLEDTLRKIYNYCTDGAEKCQIHREFNYFPNGCHGCVQLAVNKVADECTNCIKDVINPSMIIYKGTNFKMPRSPSMESNS